MVLNDAHIAYLYEVENGSIVVVRGKYVRIDAEPDALDQMIALAAEMLGLTHIVAELKSTIVALTPKGASILEDEREAWG